MLWQLKSLGLGHQEGREQEYFEFVSVSFCWHSKMGLEPSDAWFTMYGDHPQIMIGALSNDLEELTKLRVRSVG
jgi:hypothetical protein